jgi:hypothetical protein
VAGRSHPELETADSREQSRYLHSETSRLAFRPIRTFT